HAGDVNSGIVVVRFLANAIAKNCAAAERAGGIDSDNADRLPLLAVGVRYLVHQRALAGARRARHSQQYGLAAIGKQRLKQFGGLRAVVFDDGNAPRQSPRLSRANSPDKFLDVAVRGQELGTSRQDYQQAEESGSPILRGTQDLIAKAEVNHWALHT